MAALALAFVAPVSPASADEPAACDTYDVEYALNGTTKITDTKMGGGDGTWPIGPGKAVVRFDAQGNAKLLDYSMHSKFTVKANIVLASANVTADTMNIPTPNACGVVSEGTLSGKSLKWKGPWTGMRSDGTLTCEGGLCGKFGAPPSGTSPVHIPPHPTTMNSFEYADDRKTFTMAYSMVSKQTDPSQTSYVSLAGREMKRTCVTPQLKPREDAGTPSCPQP